MSLAEIGVIVLKRNEIQGRRQRIRSKLGRMKTLYENKSILMEKQRLKRASKITNYKKLSRLEAEMRKLGLESITLTKLVRERDAVRSKIEAANLELSSNKYINVESRLPKKFHKVKISDIKLDLLTLEHQFASVVLELAQFTKETSNDLRKLLKKNNSSLGYGHGTNKVRGVFVHDKFIDLQMIEKIVLDYHTENILLGVY